MRMKWRASSKANNGNEPSDLGSSILLHSPNSGRAADGLNSNGGRTRAAGAPARHNRAHPRHISSTGAAHPGPEHTRLLQYPRAPRPPPP